MFDWQGAALLARLRKSEPAAAHAAERAGELGIARAQRRKRQQAGAPVAHQLTQLRPHVGQGVGVRHLRTLPRARTELLERL